MTGKIADENEEREPLEDLLRDLTNQHGEPPANDIKWAERMLASRKAASKNGA